MLAVAALALASSAGGQSPAAKPGPPPQVFAFVSGDGSAVLEHLRRYGSRISVIAPNWYELHMGDQTLSGTPSQPVVAATRAAGAQLWPVVNARLAPDAVIGNDQARDRIARAIAVEASARGYAGITLDIEPLAVSQSGAYSALVHAVAARLHAQHEQLAVYVPRRTVQGGDRAYDWPTLTRYANLLIASGYDEHTASDPPGPITTAAGFHQTLDYAAQVSRWRVAPALGAFGYIWPARGGPGKLLSTVAADQLRQQAGARLQGAGSDTFFTADGSIVYYQTSAALAARARDARDAGMRWLALFSLGREPDSFWSHITTARQVASPSTADLAPGHRQPKRPTRDAS
jgi:spore germination protein YaaH